VRSWTVWIVMSAKMFMTADDRPRRPPNARTLSSQDSEAENFPIVQLAAFQDFQLAKGSNFVGGGEGDGESSASRMILGGGTAKNSSTRYGLFTYALIKILISD